MRKWAVSNQQIIFVATTAYASELPLICIHQASAPQRQSGNYVLPMRICRVSMALQLQLLGSCIWALLARHMPNNNPWLPKAAKAIGQQMCLNLETIQVSNGPLLATLISGEYIVQDGKRPAAGPST